MVMIIYLATSHKNFDIWETLSINDVNTDSTYVNGLDQ